MLTISLEKYTLGKNIIDILWSYDSSIDDYLLWKKNRLFMQ